MKNRYILHDKSNYLSAHSFRNVSFKNVKAPKWSRKHPQFPPNQICLTAAPSSAPTDWFARSDRLNLEDVKQNRPGGAGLGCDGSGAQFPRLTTFLIGKLNGSAIHHRDERDSARVFKKVQLGRRWNQADANKLVWEETSGYWIGCADVGFEEDLNNKKIILLLLQRYLFSVYSFH